MDFECTTLVGDVDDEVGYHVSGQGVYGKSLYLLLSFAMKLTLL